MTTITRDQAQKIIDATDEVISALAGTNDDVHPDDSKKMCGLWDDLNDRYAPPEVVRELARIALASLEAEPVAYMHRSGQVVTREECCDDKTFAICCKVEKPLYTSQPALVSVPDAISTRQAIAKMENHDPCDSINVAYKLGGNACRAAMLQGSQPVSNRDELPEEKGASLQLRNLIRQRHAEWSDATFGDVGPVGPLKHLSKEALEAAAEPDDLSEWADMQFLLWDAQRRAGISDGEITAAMDEKLKVNMARQWPEPKDGEPRLHIKGS